jgi:single-stranded-DNA-specific exonuclease
VTSPGPGGAESCLRSPDPRWEAPAALDPTHVTRLSDALRLPAVVCSILVARGHVDPAGAKEFLRPRLGELHDARLLADADKAAERIARAIRSSEVIFVHGDYDVDGICATALLTRWFRQLGGTVVPFVPHRVRDGYDFSDSGLEAARKAGADLIVTADCGTVAHETVAAAEASGIDVVVTDHHTVSASLPMAIAVLNPQRADCSYPEKGLCGTGLAYKLAELVATELGAEIDPLKAYLDLVALATVADLVPMRGENRILVSYGLRQFADTKIPGIRALMEVVDVDAATITAGQIGYVLAPRINAAGRIGESADALQLLLTDDSEEAATLAKQIDETNRQRRDEDQRTLSEALETLASGYDPERDRGVVIAGDGWHPGVIGIVASRVVERIHRPVVMIAMGEDGGRGSARSIPGFHLYEALSACAGHLERFGGHRQAAGMDIKSEELPAFRKAFDSAARDCLTDEDLHPVLRPDLEIDLSDIDLQLLHWLSYLGPHGIGNPGPLFMARAVRLVSPRVVGTNHLKTALQKGGSQLEAIGFGLADRMPPEEIDDVPHDVLLRLEKNEWRGRAQPQAKLVDLRVSEEVA